MQAIDYRIIGRTIHDFRVSQNMTQEELTELADISTSYLSKIEMGIRKPSLETLARIAYSLGVSIDDLVYAQNSIENYGLTKRLIIDLLDKCHDPEMKLIYAMIKSFLYYLDQNNINL